MSLLSYFRTTDIQNGVIENPPDVLITPLSIQGNVTFNLNIEVLKTDLKWDHAVVFKIQNNFVGYIKIQNDLEVFIDIGKISFHKFIQNKHHSRS